MLQAILFDMDGVLLDSESRHYQIVGGMLAEYGYTLTRANYLQYCGIPSHEMWPRVLRTAEIRANPEAMLREHWRRYRADLAANGLPVFPGAGDFLRKLKQQGYRLAVASGSAPATIVETVEQLGYTEYFDQIVSAQNCAHAKPEPDVFLMAAERLGVGPADCMVVEDSVNGMTAARRAGMKWAGFCGAALPPDMHLAPFSFSDYRTMTPQILNDWYDSFPTA